VSLQQLENRQVERRTTVPEPHSATRVYTNKKIALPA
jgi:hypothetical protein